MLHQPKTKKMQRVKNQMQKELNSSKQKKNKNNKIKEKFKLVNLNLKLLSTFMSTCYCKEQKTLKMQ